MATSTQRLKPRHVGKAGTVVAALDIGCSKIACLIGRVDPGSRAGFAFMGGGRQQSRGFNGGSISDIEALERSIRLAVEDAPALGVPGRHRDDRLVLPVGEHPVCSAVCCGGRGFGAGNEGAGQY